MLRRQHTVMLLLASMVGLDAAGLDFDAHRMLQYDWRNQQLGSRGTHVDLLAVGRKATDLTRRAVVVRMGDLSINTLSNLVGAGKASAALILLPPAGAQLDKLKVSRWLEVSPDHTPDGVGACIIRGCAVQVERSIVRTRLPVSHLCLQSNEVKCLARADSVFT
jgi:hypothetical protein